MRRTRSRDRPRVRRHTFCWRTARRWHRRFICRRSAAAAVVCDGGGAISGWLHRSQSLCGRCWIFPQTGSL